MPVVFVDEPGCVPKLDPKAEATIFRNFTRNAAGSMARSAPKEGSEDGKDSPRWCARAVHAL